MFSDAIMSCDREPRPSWDDIYISFAWSLARRSTCRRLSVGCVVTSTDHGRVLAIGYNGNYSGGPNDCDSAEVGNCGCLHSEENLLLKMDFNDPTEKVMYITHSPCLMCAKRIINSNIRIVVYDVMYRKSDGIELLQKNGIEVRKYVEGK